MFLSVVSSSHSGAQLNLALSRLIFGLKYSLNHSHASSIGCASVFLFTGSALSNPFARAFPAYLVHSFSIHFAFCIVPPMTKSPPMNPIVFVIFPFPNIVLASMYTSHGITMNPAFSIAVVHGLRITSDTICSGLFF